MAVLTPQSARALADRWIAAWNRKDVEAVLADFSEDVIFTSPRAKSAVGSSRVVGKSQLREYWTRSIARIQSLRFTLDHFLCDGDRLAIVYIAEIDGRRIRAVEFLNFGPDGLIHEGEVMHGVELESA
ncbi:MAG TPA: nuclear transport factor 2 family protein [Candidatus Sulfotelmatobacter sp.]|nr:nuclear transport factor 2 family protein [Candidatus Sulfotelmatobacter sp.]